MSKQSQTSVTKSDKRSRPKAKTTVVEELTDDLARFAKLPGRPGAAVDGGAIEAQAAQLGDPRLQAAQRHILAVQIGRTQGNRQLQRVVGTLKPNEKAADLKRMSRRETSSTIQCDLTRAEFEGVVGWLRDLHDDYGDAAQTAITDFVSDHRASPNWAPFWGAVIAAPVAILAAAYAPIAVPAALIAGAAAIISNIPPEASPLETFREGMRSGARWIERQQKAAAPDLVSRAVESFGEGYTPIPIMKYRILRWVFPPEIHAEAEDGPMINEDAVAAVITAQLAREWAQIEEERAAERLEMLREMGSMPLP
jgi:hypothetical protein